MPIGYASIKCAHCDHIAWWWWWGGGASLLFVCFSFLLFLLVVGLAAACGCDTPWIFIQLFIESVCEQQWLLQHSSRPWKADLASVVYMTEPPHDKTNKIECALSEDLDQPKHPPSLMRVFAVRMKKAGVLSCPLSAHRRLWSDWADAQADLSLLGAQSFCWFCHEAAHVYSVVCTYSLEPLKCFVVPRHFNLHVLFNTIDYVYW